MATFLGSPKVQYFKTGTVDYLSGGKVYSYDAGTTTPRATYPTVADALALTNANTNPVILDSRGEADIVVSGSTKIVLKDSSDNTIWTVDGIDQTSTDILDANGNELLKFVSTASAVNEFTITNAATSGTPILAATGGDTNIAFQLTSKGSGTLLLDGGSTGSVDIGTSSSGAINLKRNTAITGTLNASGAATLQSTLAVTGVSTLSAGITVAATGPLSFLPAGSVIWKASTTVPSGWLECDGSAISRTTYSALFADIGTTWGTGDGSTTFNLPTQARRVVVGKGGSGTGTLGATVGSTGGAETVTIGTTNLPSSVAVGNSGTPASATFALGADRQCPNYNGGSWTGGGGTSMTLMQPSMVMMMIIKIY